MKFEGSYTSSWNKHKSFSSSQSSTCPVHLTFAHPVTLWDPPYKNLFPQWEWGCVLYRRCALYGLIARMQIWTVTITINFHFITIVILRTGRMTQWAEHLLCKPETPSLTQGTHIEVRGENPLHRVLWLPYTHHGTCAYFDTLHTITINTFLIYYHLN